MQPLHHTLAAYHPGTLLLGNCDGWHNVPLHHIIACSSSNQYTVVTLTHWRQIVVSNSILYYQKALAPAGFVRIHQSHLINTLHLVQLRKCKEGYCAIMSGNITLPISRQQKGPLLEKLRQQSIDAQFMPNEVLPNIGQNEPNSN